MTGTVLRPRRPERSGSVRPGSASERPPTASGEDPRIAARRRAVQDAPRRRRRIVLVALAAVVVGVGLVVGMLRSPFFAVDSVVVVGDHGIDTAAVRRAAGIDRGDALVDVDTARVRERVMALPLVAAARVQRLWPHGVRITVTGEVPLAVLDLGGHRWLVGRGGRVVSAASGDPTPGLPQVEVADGVLPGPPKVGSTLPDTLEPVVAMLEQLPPRLASRLQSVGVDAKGSLTLTLAGDGGGVVLGGADDVPAKLLAVESVLVAVDLDCLQTLDVTDPARPTIRRRTGCTVGPPTVGPSTTTPRRPAGQTAPTTVAPTTGGTSGTSPASHGTRRSPTTVPNRTTSTTAAAATRGGSR